MNVKLLLGVGVVVLSFGSEVYAQHSKKEKAPVYNYTVDDPMDAFGRAPDAVVVVSPLVFPQFYSRVPIKVKDTLLKYEIYDAKDELMSVDTLHDFSIVRYISLFKSYDDPVHNYWDQGTEKPLPISKIVYRYDKTGDDKWLSVDYANNKYVTLKEYKNEIVKSDTANVMDMQGGAAKQIVYRYYKVSNAK